MWASQLANCKNVAPIVNIKAILLEATWSPIIIKTNNKKAGRINAEINLEAVKK